MQSVIDVRHTKETLRINDNTRAQTRWSVPSILILRLIPQSDPATFTILL